MGDNLKEKPRCLTPLQGEDVVAVLCCRGHFECMLLVCVNITAQKKVLSDHMYPIVHC